MFLEGKLTFVFYFCVIKSNGIGTLENMEMLNVGDVWGFTIGRVLEEGVLGKPKDPHAFLALAFRTFRLHIFLIIWH